MIDTVETEGEKENEYEERQEREERKNIFGMKLLYNTQLLIYRIIKINAYSFHVFTYS